MKPKTFTVCLLVFFYCRILFSYPHNNSALAEHLTENPVWQGCTDKFIITDGQIRLNDQTAGTSYLSVESAVIAEASWEFIVGMDFNPSSSNYAKVYLVSDNADLTAPLNGYFVRLGSTDDNICLFRQNGNTTEKLISGRLKVLDASSNLVRVMVTRDNQGYWALKYDLTGGKNFVTEGGAQDNLIKKSSYFGIVCIYTATRGTGFRFDDFDMKGQGYIDTEKPTVESIDINENSIRLHFSEAMIPCSTPYEVYFETDNPGLIPETMIRDEDPAIFTLVFKDALPCGIHHKWTLKGFTDLQHNMMRDTVLNIFDPCHAAPHDIVINEIMANPTPSVRLPEFEYIELYNRSGKNIELEGWTFSYGDIEKTFPRLLFSSGAYLLLIHPAAQSDMTGYGTVLPILGSQTAISNSGQYLQLKDRSGSVISWIDFTPDWYSDPMKTDGGWSLEQIDTEQPCTRRSNWKASIGRNGGTPGIQNSVHGNNPDTEIPIIQGIAIPDSNTIVLVFSKSLEDHLSDFSVAVYPKIPIGDIRITGKHFNLLQLNLQSPLQRNYWYDLSTGGVICDCAGNKAPFANFHFALPQYPGNSDVIINEILFQPITSDGAFVELYNRSDKAVKVNDLQISMRDKNEKLSSPATLGDEPVLLLPKEYLVVSRNTDAVIHHYGADNPSTFLQIQHMPSLTKESGKVVLLNKSLDIVDEVHYDIKQHADFLKISTGVSLERIHPERPSLDPSNWHTAAQTMGFGTPGKQNSQYVAFEATQDEVTLSPEAFSPDNDGFDDVLNINYSFDIPSLMVEVVIFDSKGRKIKQLVRRQLSAARDVITWDGSDDAGRKALTGIYIVWFHAYNSFGVDKTLKLCCVLAGEK